MAANYCIERRFLMLEEVLRFLSIQTSELDNEIEDLISSIKEKVLEEKRLKRSSNLNNFDRFKAEFDLYLSIDADLKKLQSKLPDLTLKEFSKIADIILSKVIPTTLEEDFVIEAKITKVESDKVSSPVKVMSPVAGLAKAEFVVYGDLKVLIREHVVKVPTPGVVIIPKGFSDEITFDDFNQKRSTLNPYPGKFQNVFDYPEDFFDGAFINKLNGIISNKKLNLSDLNSVFSRPSDYKITKNDLFAGIDIGGTPTNLLTVAFSNKTSGLQMGSSKIFEVSKKYENLFSQKVSSLNNSDKKLIKDGVKDLTETLLKRLDKRGVKVVVLGLVRGVNLSQSFTDKENVFQYFFRLLANQFIDSKFFLILTDENHTSQVDPTNNELSCNKDFDQTKLKRSGHKVTLSSGASVDADLNAAYNIIRIVRPFTKVTHKDNTYNLISLIS